LEVIGIMPLVRLIIMLSLKLTNKSIIIARKMRDKYKLTSIKPSHL